MYQANNSPFTDGRRPPASKFPLVFHRALSELVSHSQYSSLSFAERKVVDVIVCGHSCSVSQICALLEKLNLRLLVSVGCRENCLPRMMFLFKDAQTARERVVDFFKGCFAQPEVFYMALDRTMLTFEQIELVEMGMREVTFPEMESVACELKLSVQYDIARVTKNT